MKRCPWLRDFIDLMLHPARRRAKRDEMDETIEQRFQKTIVIEARKRSDSDLFRNALSSRHDQWRAP